MAHMKAGILIVGDEILKGQVSDTNSGYICKRFHTIGIKVCRITTVPDDVNEIAEEVAKLSQRYNIVITTGGIGPTHDDITYEGIAKGLNDKIIFHAEMAEVIRHYFHGSADIRENAALKMALIPKSSKLIYVPKESGDGGESSRNVAGSSSSSRQRSFPIVQISNVFVLPGMTNWCEEAVDHLARIFQSPDVNVYTMKLFINGSELKIINELNRAVIRFEKSVIFGSYPSVSADGNFKTKITLESKLLDDVYDAHRFLKSILPQQYLDKELNEKDVESVFELTSGTSSLHAAVSITLREIELAYSKYKFDEVCLSFNGGKDCTALLHLVWAVLRNNLNFDPSNKINTLYVKPEDPFEEVDAFVEESAERYNLNLITVSGDMKSEVEHLVRRDRNLKAVFMGTRRTDPYSQNLKSFQMCDPGWPQLMRINPLLDWNYHDVWNFLRLLDIPYCSLYNEGYTSLGSVRNTQRNPALEISDPHNTQKKYEPAYKLKDGSLERNGRN